MTAFDPKVTQNQAPSTKQEVKTAQPAAVSAKLNVKIGQPKQESAPVDGASPAIVVANQPGFISNLANRHKPIEAAALQVVSSKQSQIDAEKALSLNNIHRFTEV